MNLGRKLSGSKRRKRCLWVAADVIFVLLLFAGGLTPAAGQSPSAGQSAAGRVLDEARFEELLQTLQPQPDDRWRTIPWKISLIEAHNLAAEEAKPIFIWAMDGHPLGCT